MTAADIKRVIAKWIAPIFDSSTSIGAVASGLAKMEDLAKRKPDDVAQLLRGWLLENR